MQRIVTFDGPKAALRFELLRTALLSGGDAKGERTPATIRKEARLQDALDAISTAVPTPQDPEARTLRVSENGDGDLRLTFTQEDFDLLQQYSEKTAWTPRVSRQVVDLWDWLSSAERRD